MAVPSMKIKHTLETLNNKTISKVSSGFIFKFNNVEYIVSVHHFMPIIESCFEALPSSISLPVFTKPLWNELLILNKINNKYFTIFKKIKKYKTRFLEKNDNVTIYINNKPETFACFDYIPISHHYLFDHRSIYQKIFLSRDTQNTEKYQGLSGSPVFDDDDYLIGIFCKIIIEPSGIYGLVLPVYYLTKTLIKEDNNSVYNIDIDNFENIKIGKYDVQKQEDDLYIYHTQTNYKLPLDVYLNLEGDINKRIDCKDNHKNETITSRFIKMNDFDISTQLYKNENKYKLNNGLIAILKLYKYKLNIEEMIKIPLNDIWLQFNDSEIVSIK